MSTHSHAACECSSTNCSSEKCSCTSRLSRSSCDSCSCCDKVCDSDCNCSKDSNSVVSPAHSEYSFGRKNGDSASSTRQGVGEYGDPHATTARCFSPVPAVISSETNASSIHSLPPSKPDPNMSISTLKQILYKHIQNKNKELRNACKNYDVKGRGTMTKSQLSEVLNMFCMPMTKSQITCLLRNLPADEHGMVNYTEFFSDIGSGDFAHPTKPQSSAKKYSTIEDLEVMIRNQLLPDLQYVVRSFQMFDKNGDGFVTKGEFRGILQNYCFEIPKDDFAKVWSRYVSPDNGLLNYAEFLIRLGVNTERIEAQLPSIYQQSNLFWEKPCIKIFPANDPGYPQARAKSLIGKTNDPSIQGMTINDIQHFFLLKIRECRQLLMKMLPIFDLESKGQIALKDLCSTLNIFIMPMSEGLCKELVSRLNLNTTPISKTINYRDFLNRFCQPIASEPSPEDLGLIEESAGSACANLTGLKLMKKLKYCLNRNKKTFEHALKACDPDNCGLIHPDQLKSILTTFCFPFTKRQLEEISDTFETQANRVFYIRFLEQFKKMGEEGTSRNWIRIVGKILDQPRPEMEEGPSGNIEEKLKDAIKSKGNKMLKDFHKVDPCNLGYAYKDDVKAIIDKYVMRTNMEQFEDLWKVLPKDKKGCLLYSKLMEAGEDEDQPLEVKSRCESPLEDKRFEAKGKKSEETPSLGPSTQFQTGNKQRDAAFNAFPYLCTIYRKISKQISKRLGMIKQHLHRYDRKQEGKVRFQDLVNILTEYKIYLEEEDKFYLQEYFDKDLSDFINYRQFLQIFAADPPKESTKF